MSTVSSASDLNHFDFVIVGGGIAGVVCAETLCELLNPSRFSGALQVSSDLSDYVSKRVALISASKTVKTTINLRRISNMIETFDVEEKSSSSWSETWPNTLTVICDTMIKLDPSNHTVYLQQYGYENPIFYDKLCLTTGGVPRLIDLNHPYVIALRDTESIKTFQHRLLGTRRMLLVGNGGIATEIAYEVSGCQIIWVIKDSNISTPFLDAAAARFLLEASEISKQNDFAGKKTQCSPKSCDHEISEDTQIRRMRYVVAENDESEQQSHGSGISKSSVTGAALGPDWAYGRNLHGRIVNTVDGSLLKVVYQTKVSRFLSPQEFHDLNKPETLPFTIKNNDNYNVSSVDDWPVYVELTNDEIYGCDLVVSAVGVEANLNPFNWNHSNIHSTTHSNSNITNKEAKITKQSSLESLFDCAPKELGGGILVNEEMQTNWNDVYAAGDCAYANWTWSPHWFQMKLWNQARQMGFQAAKSMFYRSRGDNYIPLDFSFELFTHVTYFFGFKVVLLGRFNGQGMNLSAPDTYLLMRITRGREFIKCIMRSGRMQGAVLIGETDLEETLENLILNQIDLTNLEDHLLDPDIDLSDYFD
ncbi:Pyridine nucleotide-disulfide oxidoreductase domain-containing protein [Schistosoma japonicum]|uniref:Pyridine nucleotide-disulfide oxidoreductase domain-containing protein n=1 Tax=Schistosoma japonicum TaxID=6182 RepID=A0A4Z2DYI5_SCHJA|nr:Pyridine nucleotide-disulfide oxidoreductase domain-containing protein [Schistosoma japonicum]